MGYGFENICILDISLGNISISNLLMILLLIIVRKTLDLQFLRCISLVKLDTF